MQWKGIIMSNPIHMLNFKNDYFEVVEYNGKLQRSGRNEHTWKCKCKCGNNTILTTNVLKSGATKSCGCGKKNPFIKGHPYGKRFEATHGLSKHPLFRVWSHILDRCYYSLPAYINYRYYQGKGIKMCDEWKNDFKKFYDWALANGWEKGLTIDRKDSSGNYEPVNCEFVTRSENSRRMALNYPKFGEFNGNSVLDADKVKEIKRRLLLKESGSKIAKDFGVYRKTIYNIRDNKSWKGI